MFQRSAFRFGWCMVSVGLGLGLLMLALVGCHDAHRDNPFDPVLTPPVELISVVVDTTTGTATLQWTPYAGSQPFAAYWVMRKVRGIEGDTLLTAIPDVHRTRFGDQSLEPNRVYVYWIAVVNQGGFVQSSAPDTVVSFSVHGSRLLEAVVDEVKGSVFLRWSSYRGPRFERYELRRRAGVGSVESPVVFPESSDTTWTDLAVDPETEYVYSLVTFAAGEQRTTEVRVTTFSVQGSALLEARADSLKGTVSLRWECYRGARFERYEVRRSPFALKTLTEPTDTTWVDPTPLPETEYVYSVATFAAGRERVSNEMPVRYHLPSVELLRAELSSLTAMAELSWSVYPGPWFAGYEVHRQAGEFADQTVAVLTDRDRTTYTDTLLEGNTEYTYWISVRTTGGIEVLSDKRGGRFYGLEEVRRVSASHIQGYLGAVSLALDEQDSLHVAMTTSSGGVLLMSPGLLFPQVVSLRGARVTLPSPIRVLTPGHGEAYVSVGSDDGWIMVTALQQRSAGKTVYWAQLWWKWVDTRGAFPVGLHLEENGEVWMVDDQSLLHCFGADGEILEEGSDALRATLKQRTQLPLTQVVVGPGVASFGWDLFFILTSAHEDHNVFGRTRTPGGGFAGHFPYDDGIGLEDGQTYHPIALAFDRSGMRLLVLEAGRLQVFDATPSVKRHYITKWGGYGPGEGEFLASTPTAAAMAVDSAGSVYVADIVGKDVRIQVFRP